MGKVNKKINKLKSNSKVDGEVVDEGDAHISEAGAERELTAKGVKFINGSEVKIDGFNFAGYDTAFNLWYLFSYYPGLLTELRGQYDPAELARVDPGEYVDSTLQQAVLLEEYRAGNTRVMDYFLEPTLLLLEGLLARYNLHAVYLVPLPSSTPGVESPYYDRKREERNVIFCEKLATFKGELIAADIIRRVLPVERDSSMPGWSQAHTMSLEVDETFSGDEPCTFILFDDFYRTGGALYAAEATLAGYFNRPTVHRVVLGRMI